MTTALKLSPWQTHVDRWRDCDLCPLHRCRTKIVLARGKVPCDVLFVGEAPGQSEDSLGVPFCGPAGILFDVEVLTEVMSLGLRLAYTNLTACIPLDEDGSKTEAPQVESILACSRRLMEFIGIAKPRLIVCVGSLARHWLMNRPHDDDFGLPEHLCCPMIDVLHPAAILKGNRAVKSIAVKNCAAKIRLGIKQHLGV